MVMNRHMSNEDYHKHDAWSSSDVKSVAAGTLLHWKHKTYSSTPSMMLGTAVHALCLEPNADLVAEGPETRRGNEWKEAQAAADMMGQLLLPKAEFATARAMADAILATDVGKRMAGPDVINEASWFVTEPTLGVKLKTRPDSYYPKLGTIFDIKTTSGSAGPDFSREVTKYNYALQAAFYLECLRADGETANNFVFVAVESKPPYAVGVHVLSPDYLAWGRAKMFDTLRMMIDATERNEFTTGWPAVNMIDVPRWLEPEMDEDMNDFN